jgi:Fur family transcriptional regulator, ferric uptake regulator
MNRLAQLTQHGYKRTIQRAVVLDILESAGSHMTAEEIANEVEVRELALNRSTVYRTLETLAEIGVVRATRMGRAVHYEVTQEGDDHHHLRCVECRAMVHFDAGEVDELLRNDAREAGFAVSDLQVLINGVCPACRKARKGRRTGQASR